MVRQRLEELVRLLDLNPQPETGHDDFVFGNYVEFPIAAQIDPDLIPEVLDVLGVPLPFAGATTSSSLRWVQSLSSSTRALVIAALGEPAVSISESGEFLLKFPHLSTTSEETLELVDHVCPPALYESDLPESLRYGQPDPEDLSRDPDDELFDLYRSHPVALDKLIDELGSLRTTFESTQDNTVQKAVLLACFSLLESFTRQRALLNAPRFPESPKLEALILRLLRSEVRDDVKRDRVVKALEPEKSWDKQIPGWQLRNALAHDIGAVHVGEGEIIFEDDGTTQKHQTDKLFDELINYARSNLG